MYLLMIITTSNPLVPCNCHQENPLQARLKSSNVLQRTPSPARKIVFIRIILVQSPLLACTNLISQQISQSHHKSSTLSTQRYYHFLDRQTDRSNEQRTLSAIRQDPTEKRWFYVVSQAKVNLNSRIPRAKS